MKSKQIQKQISLIQYEINGDYYSYSKTTKHQPFYQVKQGSLTNNSSSFQNICSSFGTIRLEIVYIGLMIASNLFLTFVKSEEEDKIQEELCCLKKFHVNFSIEKQIPIKKAVRIDKKLVVLILREDIGDEIGYTPIITNIYSIKIQ